MAVGPDREQLDDTKVPMSGDIAEAVQAAPEIHLAQEAAAKITVTEPEATTTPRALPKKPHRSH